METNFVTNSKNEPKYCDSVFPNFMDRLKDVMAPDRSGEVLHETLQLEQIHSMFLGLRNNHGGTFPNREDIKEESQCSHQTWRPVEI